MFVLSTLLLILFEKQKGPPLALWNIFFHVRCWRGIFLCVFIVVASQCIDKKEPLQLSNFALSFALNADNVAAHIGWKKNVLAEKHQSLTVAFGWFSYISICAMIRPDQYEKYQLSISINMNGYQ